MNAKEVEKIQGIRNHTQCSKGFRCLKPGCSGLCDAHDIGLKSFLVCLEDDAVQCDFHITFGAGHYCSCPLRVYLEKNTKTKTS